MRARTWTVVALLVTSFVYVGSLAARASSSAEGITGTDVSYLRTLWTYDAGSVVAPPVADEGIVVTVTRRGRLTAFSARCRTDGGTCTPLWTADLGRMPTHADPAGSIGIPLWSASGIVVAGGLVYTVSEAGTVFAFRARCRRDGGTCTPVWTGRAGVASEPTIRVVGDTLYVGTDAILSAFRGCAHDGSVCRPAWRRRMASAQAFSGQFEATPDAVYAIAGSGRLVRRLDPATGTTVWTGGPGGSTMPMSRNFTPVVSGNRVYVEFDDLWVFPADCDPNCDPTWIGRVPEPYANGPVVTHGGVTVSLATDGQTSWLKTFPVGCTSGGKVCTTWHRTVDVDAELTSSAPVVTNGEIVALSTRAAGVFAFDPTCLVARDRCRPLWTGYAPSPAGPPVPVADVLFVGDLGTGPVVAFAADCTDVPVANPVGPLSLCMSLWKSDYVSNGPPAVTRDAVYGTDVEGVLHASGFTSVQPSPSPAGGTGGSRRTSSPVAFVVVALAVAAMLVRGALHRRTPVAKAH